MTDTEKHSMSDKTSAEQAGTRGRIEGLDLARFFALVGMVFVNFDIVMVDPGASRDVFSFVAAALQGKAAATFVVLAGIGFGLGAAGKDRTRIRAVTVRRFAFLLVVGLVNATIFEADIIHFYAFYFLAGMWFLQVPSRWLLLTIGGLAAGFVVLIVTLDYEAGWDWETYAYHDFWTIPGFVRHLVFNGWHPIVPWLAFLLWGILLSRLNLRGRGVQWRMLLGGAAICAATLIASAWLVELVQVDDPEAAILFTAEPIPPMPLYLLAGGGFASAVVGSCLLIEGRANRHRWAAFCLPAGRQTLTLYLAHIVIGMGTFEALGMIGTQTNRTAFFASIVFCLLATIFARIWSRFFARGPMEAVMRWVTG